MWSILEARWVVTLESAFLFDGTDGCRLSLLRACTMQTGEDILDGLTSENRLCTT